MRALLLVAALLAWAAPAWATTRAAATCAVADVNTQIALSSAGDTVTIPAGDCTWTTAATALNGVALTGAGSPRIIGRSTSTVTLATGTRVFTVIALNNITFSVTAGQTLNIYRVGDRGQFLTGTVTSYAAPTLTMDITSVGSAGNNCSGLACPANLWIIMQVCDGTTTTCITDNVASGATMLTMTEHTAFRTEISGFKIVAGTGSGQVINMAYTSSGKAMLLHDCWIESNQTANIMINSNTNRGVVWNCSFDSSPGGLGSNLGFQLVGTVNTWTALATMGTADTTGESNVYFEKNDYHTFLNFFDAGDNGKMVARYSTFNTTGLGTHGPDTGNYGQRHFEAYNNEWIWDRYGNGTTIPLTRVLYVRGGTFVFTDNAYTLDGTSGSDYALAGVDMTVMNLQRNAGPNPCYGAPYTVHGENYPAPRQVGFGRVTGAAGNDSITYKGDIEPAYIWGNTGTAFPVGTSDFGGVECTTPDGTAYYVVAGRDYFADETAKPSYTKYTYPHPLASGAVNPAPGVQIGGNVTFGGNASWGP